MLIVLAWWFQTRRSTTFFIEEPEAHLFPVSQRRLVEIFARLAAARDHRFLLTTHSPYILTAINTLIMAGNLIEERGDDIREEVLRIIGGNKLVRFEDVSAYTIKDGSLESILDDESRLIGSSVIDSVSDEFESVFDRLLELQLG
jgi:predicted ATPase